MAARMLGDTLHARGAHVDYVACYRREAPRSRRRGFARASVRGRAHALTLTSVEGLDNLLRALGAAGQRRSRAEDVRTPPAHRGRSAGRGPRRHRTAAGDAGLMSHC
jgi:uroporphyrinogen-III synthase